MKLEKLMTIIELTCVLFWILSIITGKTHGEMERTINYTLICFGVAGIAFMTKAIARWKYVGI